MEIEMTVRLLVPDATAITALHTLERMGISPVKKLRREDYYRFTADGDFSAVSAELSKVDVIVNANKHRCRAKRPGEPFGDGDDFPGLATVRVLVQDGGGNGGDASPGFRGGGNDEALLSTLRDRLGIGSVSRVERGVLWTLGVKARTAKDAEKAARRGAEELLSNKHFQQYIIIGGGHGDR